MSAIGSFIWYELMTGDAMTAAKFYGAVVGWKIADRTDPQCGMGCRATNGSSSPWIRKAQLSV